ncbi:MAG: hypothetical protein HY870_09970 [Chloroflexi bacterium]|nr:hypothetical protein [Chloroflexota bacterium]
MSKIEKRVVIDDSTERVFSYIGEPVKSPEVWPGLLEVREVHHLIGDIRYASWLYKLTGLYEALDIQLEYEADQAALTRNLRGLDLVMTLDYRPCSACGPRLALDGDYTYWSQC